MSDLFGYFCIGVVVTALIYGAYHVGRARERYGTINAASNRNESEFQVRGQHLLEWLSQPEIERRETVVDPLHAVPPVAFGHLHPAWHRFLEARLPGDELWSFTAHLQPSWDEHELWFGYALVRGGAPVARFLTVRKKTPAATSSGDVSC